jgi:hypothetical protein
MELPEMNPMDSQHTPTLPKARASEMEANRSVAGEEDPGASLDAVSPGGLPSARSEQDALLLRRAVARWENEGGSDASEAGRPSDVALRPAADKQLHPDLGNAELVQLQLRVIALENTMTALLAYAPPETAELARRIAANITPRVGSTPHHLTVRAAAQMIHLLDRSQASKNSDSSADK